MGAQGSVGETWQNQYFDVMTMLTDMRMRAAVITWESDAMAFLNSITLPSPGSGYVSGGGRGGWAMYVPPYKDPFIVRPLPAMVVKASREEGETWDPMISNARSPASDWTNALDFVLGMGELARQVKVYEIFGRSAETVENVLKKGQYVHTNGKVYSQGFRGNQYISSKSLSNSLSAAKLARNLGRGMTLVGTGISLYQFGISNKTGADYARLAGAAFITGSVFIPVVGPFISIELGVADSFGAFDSIYNSFGP